MIFLGYGHTFICGDLNLTIGNVEIWGEATIIDPLLDYHVSRLGDYGLVDI